MYNKPANQGITERSHLSHHKKRPKRETMPGARTTRKAATKRKGKAIGPKRGRKALADLDANAPAETNSDPNSEAGEEEEHSPSPAKKRRKTPSARNKVKKDASTSKSEDSRPKRGRRATMQPSETAKIREENQVGAGESVVYVSVPPRVELYCLRRERGLSTFCRRSFSLLWTISNS